MTLLITEFHITGDLTQTAIVFAADRRLTVAKAAPVFRKKIQSIPHLNAGVGYAGVAQVRSGEYLSSWLKNFISHSADCASLADFANKLAKALSGAMSPNLLATKPSIFHIAGHNPAGLPELWHIRNCAMDGNVYRDCKPQYTTTENFLREDACSSFSFDGVNPILPKAGVIYYVNGDVLPFHAAWKTLDSIAGTMFVTNSFQAPTDEKGYKKLIEWKIGVIADFYRTFANNPIIGKPIDCFVLH